MKRKLPDTIALFENVTQITKPWCRHVFQLIATMLFIFAIKSNATAQCDWTFYADSLRQVMYGGIVNGQAKVTSTGTFELARELTDVNGVKYIYLNYKNEVSEYYRITRDGRVFPGDASPYPLYHLCDTVGAIRLIGGTPDSNAIYMQYIGLYPYYALGKNRVCKVFLRLSDFEDSIVPTQYYYLADSLGVVAEVEYYHSWQRNEVIGIWFGNRFVGDPLVGVAEENQQPNGITIRYRQDQIIVSGITEQDVGRLATLQLYDLYGRVLFKRKTQLESTNELSVTQSNVHPSVVIAWVLEIESGRVVRGVTVAE
ncbi:MAG: hypothetical protein HQ472_08965 [Ignavibacteria bacterium]|nr:hypothetical protein [Ignavibacteria bacterium]